jgi:serine/threonine-protein kinase
VQAGAAIGHAPPASRLNPALPAMLDAALARAMTKERDGRTPSVARFVAALRKALGPG